jgi:hypothetical protein
MFDALSSIEERNGFFRLWRPNSFSFSIPNNRESHSGLLLREACTLLWVGRWFYEARREIISVRRSLA